MLIFTYILICIFVKSLDVSICMFMYIFEPICLQQKITLLIQKIHFQTNEIYCSNYICIFTFEQLKHKLLIGLAVCNDRVQI